jgi:hypothetical protein
MDGVRLQFSLASMFVAMTAAGVLCGIGTWIASVGFIPTDADTWQMLGVFGAAFSAIGYGVYSRYN